MEKEADTPMRNYRDHNKRQLYSEYQTRSEVLKDQLKSGEISQEEFERAHELLDDKYRVVR